MVFADLGREFDTGQDATGVVETLKLTHWTEALPDAAVILFDHVV